MVAQNKFVQLFIAIVGIIIAIWLTTSSVTLPTEYQAVLLISIILIVTLLLIGRGYAFDFKLLCLLCLGYSLAGKGFAYISPFEPVYIGEITLVICILGLVVRSFIGQKILPTFLHKILLGWMLVVFIYLMSTIQVYGTMAIRDSSVAYYAIFFFAAYGIFQNQKATEAFSWILKICVAFAYIACFILSSGIFEKYIAPYPIFRFFFSPHPDAFIPLVAAGTIYGLLQGVAQRNIITLVSGLVGFFLLLSTKTAGIFCLISVIGVFIIFAKRMDILFTSLSALLLSGIIIAIMFASGSDYIENKILESDQFQTLQDVGKASGKANSSTSDWRISWWTIVTEDTLAENPLTGVGMGGDITSHFLESVMRMDLGSKEAVGYARYPHNIIFTILGRMGLIGLFLFLFPFLSLIGFGIRFIRYNLITKEENKRYLIAAAAFFSGIMNALVQSTYETPFAAIIHWTCLGYLAAYAFQKKTNISST